MNQELRRLWGESGYVDSAQSRKEIAALETKIANIRRAIEDGLTDASRANSRLRELYAEREVLTAALNTPGPPQLDSATVMAYSRETAKLMESGHRAERKRLLRNWVHEIKLKPESLEVSISYRVPDVVMKGVGCGGWI
ncbi:MAG TPA: hypothetical protein VEO19_03295 [Terriglobia bacterium]|nr:hypothetical protein [Terriglobia bacterium]